MKFRKIADRVVMAIAGGFLIMAAILKMHQLLNEPIISKGFWESWLFFVIQIPLELGLGIWLCCGLFRKAVWLLGVIAYGGFLVVTLHKAVTGQIACGCFGTVEVNPWITFSFVDVPIFLLLLIFYPKGEKLFPPPWPSAEHFWGVAIPTFFILGTIFPVLALNKVQREQPWLPVPGESSWAMLNYIDIADSLTEGVVVVLFYHNDCPDCKEVIPVYNELENEYGGIPKFAFIEAPPYGDPGQNPVPPDTTALTGKLDASRKWFFATPLVVVLQDGAALKAWEVDAPDMDEILDAVAQGSPTDF